jgi:hypothetical protein
MNYLWIFEKQVVDLLNAKGMDGRVFPFQFDCDAITIRLSVVERLSSLHPGTWLWACWKSKD